MDPDTPFRILFRTWSSSSAGSNSPRGFKSGDQNHREFDELAIGRHFDNHRKMSNRVPTCFISTTDDPVRALRYAIVLATQGERNVRISIIRSNDYLQAEDVAAAFGLNDALFKTEFLFLWKITAADILHVVSLDTMVRSGLLKRFKVLDPDCWDDEDKAGAGLPPLSKLRMRICENNENAWFEANETTWPERSGRFVAAIAKCFGNGAPQRAIASLIWDYGTHFEPEEYEYEGFDLRVKAEIQRSLGKNTRSCEYDEWCGELAII